MKKGCYNSETQKLKYIMYSPKNVISLHKIQNIYVLDCTNMDT